LFGLGWVWVRLTWFGGWVRWVRLGCAWVRLVGVSHDWVRLAGLGSAWVRLAGVGWVGVCLTWLGGWVRWVRLAGLSRDWVRLAGLGSAWVRLVGVSGVWSRLAGDLGDKAVALTKVGVALAFADCGPAVGLIHGQFGTDLLGPGVIDGFELGAPLTRDLFLKGGAIGVEHQRQPLLGASAMQNRYIGVSEFDLQGALSERPLALVKQVESHGG